jgi:phosphatidylethanolamine/phosphatidyl-N-methylethanolamine N-methyltransferase
MAKMHEATTSRVYDAWARCYDATFGRLVHKRQVRAIQQLGAEPGQWVLDLGIGTGITLDEYPVGVRVVGMDLSAGMLAKANVKARGLAEPRPSLVQADAMHPPFAEASFDHVLITHTVSVVSDPPRLMRWAAALVKPGGRVVVLNHFRSDWPPLGWAERTLNPLCTRLGWRSDLSLDDCLGGAPLRLVHQFQCSRPDVWRIAVLTRDH